MRRLKTSSHKIVDWLIRQEVISELDKELYMYALEIIIITSLPLILTALIGIVLGMFLEGVIVILPFMCLRKYAGGYHARTAKTCFVLSWGTLTLLIYSLRYIQVGLLFHFILFLSIVILLILSPVDSKEKRLMETEKSKHKVTVVKIIIFWLITYICLIFLHQDRYAICTGMGIILSASLQVPYIIRNDKKLENDHYCA